MYFPFVLRLYGHTLHSIRDHNYTGLDLFYHIKDCWKRRDTPHDLLLRPLERGLSFKICEWCYDTMFDIEAANASTTKPYIAKLYKEDVLWFLEDVAEAAKLSGLFDKEVLEAIETRINEIGDLYDKNETEYWRQVDGRGRRDLIGMFFALCRNYSTPLSQLKELYASEIADRILHDRQLCNFLAETVMNIGFDGETHEGLRTQWMQRESWPSRVKTILN